MEANEIAESEVVEMGVELEVYDAVKVAVDAAKERCSKIILKYDTPQDIKESKSFIYQLRQLKAPINQAHKEGKAEALRFTKAMDARRNELIGVVEEMIEEKYAPIKVIEDAAKKDAEETEAWERQNEICEQERRQAEYDAEMEKLAISTAELAAKQAEFDRMERETRIAEEAKKATVIEAANKLFQAEEKARQDAINAKEAAAAAENRRIADVQREKDKAAAEAQEKERAIMEEQRIAREKKEAEEMAETARINDEKHRSDVHRAIYTQFVQLLAANRDGEQLDNPVLLTQALIDGKIPHVKIQY